MEQKMEQIQNVSEEITTKKKKKWYVMGGIPFLLLVVVAVVGIAYGRKAVYYQTHFFPNTFINNMDCSELEAEVVSQMMDAQAQEYSLLIKGRDNQGNVVELGSIQGSDIALSLTDSLATAGDILDQQKEWYWFEAWQGRHYNYSVVQGVTFDEEALKAQIEVLDAFQKEKNMGNELDVESVISVVSAAIYGNSDRVNLEEQGCYVQPKVTSEDK